ncbi:unnamed protein product [Cochlearia groenlandica]
MKIRCDVCDKQEASVFCTADEASLCDGCDHRVHHANKLASKHLRFSLIYPSSSSSSSNNNNKSSLCDICQEKKALFFCQQDRAILCKDCDSSIHLVNEHTKKHDRFLLTGVKLSATSSVYKPTSQSSSSSTSSDQDCSVTKIQPLSKVKCGGYDAAATATAMNEWGGATSTISEYLIDTLPGWHVEDFLDSSLPPFGFSKSGNDDGVLPYIEANEDNNTKRNNNNKNKNKTVSLPSKNNMGIWVPQVQQTLPNSYTNQYYSQDNNNNIEFGIYNKEVESNVQIQNMKQQGHNKRWYDDGGFTVPTFDHNSTKKKTSSFW